MVHVYRVTGDREYIVSNPELGVTDFEVAASPQESFEDYQVEDFTSDIHVKLEDGEELKWGYTTGDRLQQLLGGEW